jgi:hypothetical protein
MPAARPEGSAAVPQTHDKVTVHNVARRLDAKRPGNLKLFARCTDIIGDVNPSTGRNAS